MSSLRKAARAVLFEFICCLFFYGLIYGVIINIHVVTREAPVMLLIPLLHGLVNLITIALTIFLVIVLFGPMCGAHINPLYTFAVMISRQFPLLRGLSYIACQCVASALMAFLVPVLFKSFSESASGYPTDIARLLLVLKAPTVGVVTALMMELILSFVLIFAIFVLTLDPASMVTDAAIAHYARCVAGQSPNKSNTSINAVHVETCKKETSSEALMNNSVATTIAAPLDASSPVPEPWSPLPMSQKSLLPANDVEVIMAAFQNLNGRLTKMQEVMERRHQDKQPRLLGGAVGALLMILCFFGGSISGAAFNIARVFGPSIIVADFSDQWLYWVGQFTGAVLGTLFFRFVYLKSRMQLYLESCHAQLDCTSFC